MAEIPNLPAFPSDALRPAGPARPTGAAAPSGTSSSTSTGTSTSSPAFEALLERLTTRAAEVEEKTKRLASPGELADALDAARASLEDALHLGSELLEAFRAAQQGREAGR